MADIVEYRLDIIRKHPLDYLTKGDMWQFNFAMLNFNMNHYKVRLNPKYGRSDESIADWATLYGINIDKWFYDQLEKTDTFIPL